MGLFSLFKKETAPIDRAELQRQFYDAAADRDHVRTNKLLARGADPNAHNGKALKEAFNSRAWSMASLLISKGADPNLLGFDPMDAAIWSGEDELAKKLYKQGYKVNTSDSNDNALLAAIERRDFGMFNWVKSLPEIDIRFGGDKPLQRAFENKYWYAVRQLLDQGADASVMPFDPLDVAISNGEDDLAKQLYKKGFKPNVTDSADNALLVAIGRRDFDMFNWVKSLPEIDARFGGDKPLQRAFEYKYWYAVRQLLDHGADASTLPFDPLDVAIRNGEDDLAKQLYKKGFKPNVTDSEDNALLVAIERRDFDMFNWVKNLKEIDVRFGGEKPLQRAFENKYWYAVKALLDMGADANAMPFDPLDAAIRGGEEDLVKKLYKLGFKPNTASDDQNALITAIERGDSDVVIKILAMPEVNVHVNNEEPLRRAFEHNKGYIISLLIDAGADPKALPFDPVLAAAARDNDGLVKKLHKLGMALDKVSNGQTPLSAATAYGGTDCVAWLLKQNVNVNAARGAAIKAAASRKNWHLANVLMKNGADGTALLGIPDLPEETRALAEKTALKASARQTIGMRKIGQRQARKRRPSP